jgi:signal transduction histidine kinase
MQGNKAKIENVLLFNIINTEINNLASEASNKKLNILNNVPTDLSVSTDFNMLSVIFRNFLSNAIKFSNVDGSIFFDVQVLNHQAIIKITDQGVGITDKLLEQFNAEKIEFASESSFGTNKEKGTGLGFYLIKNFVKIIDGDVKVSKASERNGTTFTLILPVFV